MTSRPTDPELEALRARVKELEQRLRETEDRLELFVDNPLDAMFAIDGRGVVLDVNAGACRLLGYSRQEMIGRSARELFHTDDLAERDLRLDVLNAGIPVQTVRRMVHKDGRTVWVENNVRRLSDGRIQGTARDITERIEAERERAELDARARQARKLEGLGLLAGGIAHDFNNILVGILGHAHLAQAELEEGSPVAREIAEIELNAHHAADLCRQLLAYAGKGRFHSEPLDLSAVVGRMERLIGVSVAPSALVEYRLDPNLPPVEADASQLRQIVMNLVINASEALPEKGGTIVITTDLVDSGALGPLGDDHLEAQPVVRLRVSDDGHGMDGDTQARIFDPFYSTKFPGRGLGMSAVMGIVQAHRGSIQVSSAPDSGTTIAVLLRAAQPDPNGVGPDTAPLRRTAKTAVVVDSDEAVRLFARRVLESAGYEVWLARDGYAGLELVSGVLDHIGLALVDVTGSVAAAEAFLNETRDRRPGLPTVVSGGLGADVPESLARGGTTELLRKPYTAQGLLSAVNRALEGAD